MKYNKAGLIGLNSATTGEYYYFAENGDDVTSEVKELVVDIANITDKEQFMLNLKYGRSEEIESDQLKANRKLLQDRYKRMCKEN